MREIRKLSPEERAAKIAAKNDGEMDAIVNRRIPAVLSAGGLSKPRKYFRLLEIADRAAELVGPETPCRRGCSACCHMAVGMGSIEAQRIALKTGRQPQVPPPYVDTRVNVSRYTGVPCPFLKENICTIYDVRPLACRIHHSLMDDAEPCNTKTNPGAKVASLNHQHFDVAAALLMADEPFGDIREFFP